MFTRSSRLALLLTLLLPLASCALLAPRHHQVTPPSVQKERYFRLVDRIVREEKPTLILSQTDRPSLYPRTPRPAEKLYLFDSRACDDRTKILVSTAQGLINRESPRLYVFYKKPEETANVMEQTALNHDQRWLAWLVKGGYINQPEPLASLEDVLKRFGVRRVVQVDPALPVSLNIATMIGAVEGLAVAYPEQVRQYKLEVAQDLTGRWKTNAEAYEWAFQNLWPKMDHTAIAWLAPSPNLSHPRDYLIAHKIFTLWVTAEKDGVGPGSNTADELRVAARILGQMPVNIPVLGFPWAGWGTGIGEGPGVRLLSNYGKWMVPADWKTNLTIWGGIEPRHKKFRQPAPRPLKLEAGKVYVAYVLSDGDNLNTWYDYFPAYWDSPHHGQIPMGWAMGPSLIDLQPALLDFYAENIKPTDSIGASVSGVGYVYPDQFATAFSPEERERVWGQFFALTERTMKRLDMRWVHLMGHTAPHSADVVRFARALPWLDAVTPGYNFKVPYAKANYLEGAVPVMHTVNDSKLTSVSTPARAGKVAATLAKVTRERPAFLCVFIHNWKYTYDDIKALTDALPKNFEVVRPDELAILYKQHLAQQKKGPGGPGAKK